MYGVVSWYGHLKHYIQIENYDKYPLAISHLYFNLINDQVSSYWRLAFDKDDDIAYFVIPEWASNTTFYERLLEGYQEEEEVFQKYRQLMDQEFDI